MPQNNKAAQTKIRDIIKQINQYAGTNLSYKDLYRRIDGALKVEGAERENRLSAIYIDVSREIEKKILPIRTLIQSNDVLGQKYRGHKAEKFSITTATRDAKKLILEFCDMMEPDHPEKHEITPNQLDAIRDYGGGYLLLYTNFGKDVSTIGDGSGIAHQVLARPNREYQ